MPQIKVEVIYALADHQTIVHVQLDLRSTVRQAIDASGILHAHPEIDLEHTTVGIWSKSASLDDSLLDGDRVEIYRPLIADPKIVRRRKAGDATSRKESRRRK